MFKWFKRKDKSYAQKKRELEISESVYKTMNSLSDNQLDKWIKVKIELEEMKYTKGSITYLNNTGARGHHE